ncbi:MAG TPA: hypothetical protein VFW17_02495, partial [Ktedonobacterales bacterium]|nr:hypothetical protein [Ktedonobacterales bacterium]
RYEDMAFTVLGTKGRRITKLRVERGLPPAQPDDAASETPSGGDTPLALPAAQDSSANIPAPPSHPRQ